MGLVQSGAREGYLLATTLHAAPNEKAAIVESVGRGERVRVVPLAGKKGWVAVYREGDGTLVGYANDPFVSRFGPDGRPEPEASTPAAATPAKAPAPEAPAEPRLPEVAFADAATGVWSEVAEWSTVHTTPSRRSEAIGVIRPGVPFRLVAFERGWGRVLLKGTHSVGYVSGTALRQVKNPPAPTAAPAPASSPAAPAPTATEPVAAAPMPTAVELGVDPETMTVYVTPAGKRYHHADCRHVVGRGSPLPLLEAAKRYTPCRVCRPPAVD